MSKTRKLLLTGNDLALAQQAAGLAIAWVGKPKSKYSRTMIKQFRLLILRLDAISDYAYPYENADQMPGSIGDEPIMIGDGVCIGKTRAAAAKAIKANPSFARETKSIRSCRNCGCTDRNCSGCIARAGKPCHWVKKDLCSACVPRARG